MTDLHAECLAMAEEFLKYSPNSGDRNKRLVALLRRVADAMPQEPHGDVVEAAIKALWPFTYGGGEADAARAVLSAAEPFIQARIAEAAVEPGGWQPIETAPTCQDVLCAKWLSPHRCFLVVAQKVPAYSNRWISDGGPMALVPTHWRPLPDPPAIQDKPEGGE